MENHPSKRLIVALTGASGSCYARLLVEALLRVELPLEIALIVSHSGEQVATFEDSVAWFSDPRLTRYEADDLFAPPASGSSEYEAMVVIPCSMGTAGRIASGVSNDLITRAADVMLKERRPLILVPRESPLSLIHLRNLTTLAEAGAIICPASPAFYSQPKDIEALSMSVVERVLSLLKINTPRYRWGEQPSKA